MNSGVGRNKRRVGMVLAATLAISFIGSSPAEAATLRSGKILGGYIVLSGQNHLGPGCALTPDCRVWLESKCDPALAGLDPALYTSIVNVQSLAGSTVLRKVTLHRDSTSVVPNYGGLTVQFWSSACRPTSSSLIQVVHGKPAPRFRVPRGTKWMTVASFDAISVSWTLS
jgi:hypothetical protein